MRLGDSYRLRIVSSKPVDLDEAIRDCLNFLDSLSLDSEIENRIKKVRSSLKEPGNPLVVDEIIKRKLGKILERREIQNDDTYYFLYHDKNIEFHDIPIPSGSPNSDARYYVWDNKTGLLLQKILPHSKTSCNSEPPLLHIFS